MKHLIQNQKILSALSQKKLSFLISVFAFAIIGFILPWWSILILGACIGWNQSTLIQAFLRSLLACFAAWLLLSLTFDLMSTFRISMRLGGLVGLPIPLAANLFAATVGGLLAAFAAATSHQARKTLSLLR